MLPRIASSSPRLVRRLASSRARPQCTTAPSVTRSLHSNSHPARHVRAQSTTRALTPLSTFSPHHHGQSFSTSSARHASPQPADAVVETLTDLYGTARDEFEIAAEETEKKTVYAADDRDAAREAFAELKTAFEQAVKVSDPEVAKEVQGRVGQRIRELESALTALEESAMED